MYTHNIISFHSIIYYLHWKTDTTPATQAKNLGILIRKLDDQRETSSIEIISHKEKDLFDAVINIERRSVVTSEPNAGQYVKIPGLENLWDGKSLHLYDGPTFLY